MSSWNSRINCFLPKTLLLIPSVLMEIRSLFSSILMKNSSMCSILIFPSFSTKSSHEILFFPKSSQLFCSHKHFASIQSHAACFFYSISYKFFLLFNLLQRVSSIHSHLIHFTVSLLFWFIRQHVHSTFFHHSLWVLIVSLEILVFSSF